MSFLFRISKYVSVTIITEWLYGKDIIKLMSSTCNKDQQKIILSLCLEFTKAFSAAIFSKIKINFDTRILNWAKHYGLDWHQSICKLTELTILDYWESRSQDLLSLRMIELLPSERPLVVEYPEALLANLNFQHLNVCHFGLVKDDSVMNLIRNAPHLTELRVESYLITERTIMSLIVYGKNLKSLHLESAYYHHAKQSSMFFLHNRASLTYLQWPDYTQSIFPLNCMKLTTLILADMHDAVGMERISIMCPNLTHLNLDFKYKRHYKPQPSAASIVAGLSQLMILKLNYQLSINDEELYLITVNCPAVQHIECYRIGHPFSKRTIESIATQWNNLTTMHISDGTLNDSDFITIIRGCKLTGVNVSGNFNLTNNSFIVLSECCTKLKQLFAVSTSIGDLAVIAIVTRCKWLISLNVKDSKVSHGIEFVIVKYDGELIY